MVGLSKNWIDAFKLCGWRSLLRVQGDSKKIKPVNTKGNHPRIFIGRIDAEAEVEILWWPDAKSQLTGQDPDAESDLEQEAKGVTEDEMDTITDTIDMNLSKLWEIVEDREAWHAAVHGESIESDMTYQLNKNKNKRHYSST